MTEAARWLDTLHAHPDRCLGAADWFEQQGRPDLADVLRRRASAGNEAGAADELERDHLGLDAQVQSAILEMACAHPLRLLGERASFRFTRGEPYRVVDRPDSRWRWPFITFRAAARASPTAGQNAGAVEPVLLVPHVCCGVRTWRNQRREFACCVWAGRSSAGLLHVTLPPAPAGFDQTN